MKLLKVPFNAGALSKKKGLEKAPDAIANELQNFYLKETGVLPFFDIEEIKIDNSNAEQAHKDIYGAVENLLGHAILLGGDHSLTYSSFRAFSKKYKNPGLIVFDAHLDCENDFSPPTHEDYLRVLIEEGHLKKENAIAVGIRNIHTNELEFSKKTKLKIYDMKEISSYGKTDLADAIMSVARTFDGLYISIDIDVLDPAFAPGTGYIEPGGMTTRELLYFIHRLKNMKNIGMWDLVEVNPDKDINKMTVMAAAKLIVEMS
jgi:formiminoglutamase